ncbi:MAG: sensor domain-containing diguanylate cyclase [Bacillota bacterium]
MQLLDLFIKNRRIQTSLLIGFMVFIILPAMVVGIFSFVQSKNVMKQSVFNTLEYLTDAQGNAINNWVTARKNFLEGLAQNERIKALDLDATGRILTNSLKMDRNFRSLTLVGSDGAIKVDPVFNANLREVYVTDREYFRQAMSGKTYVSEVLLSKINNEPVLIIATPVKREHEGIVGVLYGAVNIGVITELVQQNFPGQRGESYLINQDGVMISESKFVQNFEPLEIKPQNKPVDQVSRGLSGKAIYTNYHNKKVFGVYRWLPEMKMGLVVEKQYTGALLENGLDNYLKVLSASLVIIALFMVFALFYSRRLTKPLERLAAEVNSIAEGNFQTVLDMQANKEVQELGRAINHMSSTLLAKTNRLNDLIAQLEQSTEDLYQEKNKLAKISITDELTCLYNRRYINQELDRFTQLSRALGKNISLMMLDLDHFKLVNDTFGHATGDVVLKEFAQLLRQCSRGTDVIGRFGGEEFIIIVPFISGTQVKEIAERIRQEVSNTVFDADDNKIKVTVSIGVVTLIPSMDEKVSEIIEKTIRIADECLYEAKRSGRNRVVQQILAPE